MRKALYTWKQLHKQCFSISMFVIVLEIGPEKKIYIIPNNNFLIVAKQKNKIDE